MRWSSTESAGKQPEATERKGNFGGVKEFLRKLNVVLLSNIDGAY
jgi:hypothetical protein